MNYCKDYEICHINKKKPYVLPLGFATFFEMNHWLFAVLLLILLAIVGICIPFAVPGENFANTLLSVLTSSLIYIGTCILTITLSYRSWQMTQLEHVSKRLYMDVFLFQVAERKYIKNKKNRTTFFFDNLESKGSQITFKIYHDNTSNLRILDFDLFDAYAVFNRRYYTLPLSIDKVITKKKLYPISPSSEFEANYSLSTKEFKAMLKDGVKMFIIINVVVDEFFQEYYIINCIYQLDSNSNELVFASTIYDESEFKHKFSSRFHRRTIKKILKEYELKDVVSL